MWFIMMCDSAQWDLMVLFPSASTFLVRGSQDPKKSQVKEPGDLGLDFELAEAFCMVRNLALDVGHPIRLTGLDGEDNFLMAQWFAQGSHVISLNPQELINEKNKAQGLKLFMVFAGFGLRTAFDDVACELITGQQKIKKICVESVAHGGLI